MINLLSILHFCVFLQLFGVGTVTCHQSRLFWFHMLVARYKTYVNFNFYKNPLSFEFSPNTILTIAYAQICPVGVHTFLELIIYGEKPSRSECQGDQHIFCD